MTTAAQQISLLSGLSGATAAQHLWKIAGSYATAGAMLVAFSGMLSAEAALHLLAGPPPDDAVDTFPLAGKRQGWLDASQQFVRLSQEWPTNGAQQFAGGAQTDWPAKQEQEFLLGKLTQPFPAAGSVQWPIPGSQPFPL